VIRFKRKFPIRRSLLVTLVGVSNKSNWFVFSVRCRAYSGLASSKLENKSEEHELGDDDDVVDDKLKFVRNCVLSVAV